MFELTERTEYLFCIECGRNDFVHQSIDGRKFHVNYVTYDDVENTSFVGEAVECFGPFAHSEPETIKETDLFFSTIPVHWEMIKLKDEEYAAYLESFEQIRIFDKYYPSLQETWIDNVRGSLKQAGYFELQ